MLSTAVLFFFFKQKTAYEMRISDWSSDVCSSDLNGHPTPTGNIKWGDYDDLSTYTIARSNITYKDDQNKILTDQLNLRYDFNTGAVEHSLSTGLDFTREADRTSTRLNSSH